MHLVVGAFYPVKAGGLFAAAMLLAIRSRRDGHPFARFGTANQVTAARLLIVAAMAGCIGEPATPAVAMAVVAAAMVVVALDGVDGWLARRTRMVSPFGARFDEETDALLILVLAILVWRFGRAGPWVLMAGLLRYLFVASGAVWLWMRRPLTPTRRARVICVAQVLALILALIPPVAPLLAAWTAGVGLLLLSCSFLVDTRRLWRQAE
jgi:phosphatidylglycerophosphate synthase